jgi:hypothetical protein
MKTSTVYDEFYEAKLEGVKLDNKYKRVLIWSFELEQKKLQKEDDDE